MHKLRAYLSRQTQLVLLVVLSMALGASLFGNLARHDTAYAVDQKTVTQEQRAVLYDLQSAFTSLAEQITPSVVSITSIHEDHPAESSAEQDPDDNPFKGLPFPFPFSTPSSFTNWPTAGSRTKWGIRPPAGSGGSAWTRASTWTPSERLCSSFSDSAGPNPCR